MGMTFNPPPGWPPPPAGWVPPQGWVPPPHWPPAPAGWQFWTATSTTAGPAGLHPPGPDRAHQGWPQAAYEYPLPTRPAAATPTAGSTSHSTGSTILVVAAALVTVLLAAVGVAWAAGLVGGDWIARNYDVDRTSQEYAEGWDAGRKVASGVGTTTGAQVVRSCTDILKLDYGGQLPPNESTFIGCVEGASESLYLDPVEVLKNK